MNSPDRLVLKVTENGYITTDSNYINDVDNIIYILYDNIEHKYILHAKRKITELYYSFTSKSRKSLIEFIMYLCDPDTKLSLDMYNYDNLPYEISEVDFDFLERFDDKDYLLFGHIFKNKPKLHKSKIYHCLSMLKNVYNT